MYHCNSNIVFDILPTEQGSIVSWNEPFAIDASGSVDITQSHHSRTVFQPGNTVVTYNFTDDSGNVASCVFNVTVPEGICMFNKGVRKE